MHHFMTFCSIFFLYGTLLHAQMTTFTGNHLVNPNKWNEADNWDTGIVPLSGDTVVIDGDSVSITTVSPELYYLELKNGASLLNRKQLTFTNGDTFAIRLTESTLRNEGNIFVDEAGDNYTADRAIEAFNGSMLINDSLIYIENMSAAGIYVIGAKLVNNGIIHVQAQGTAIFCAGEIFNQDSIFLSSTFLSALSIASSGEFNNAESAIVDGNAQFNTGLYCQGYISNFGKISQTSKNRALFLRSNSSFLHQSGLVVLVSSNSTGGSSTLTIETSANLDISAGSKLEIRSSASYHYIDVETGGTLDCRGVIETMVEN
ncbi:MAG: hypothetical protein IPL46_28195 [Saprospiraceae bacterium]|nr:hypothetical protein [Saprospiraceae bacterium]